ncbi:hypothetical protein PRIPAC_94399 [Pristionchus pacificus]|uniref:Pyridoxine-5'-phosphate oxidase n=1 Tax=Pristionchus pacificus TaxID=54126 RepID=A0A2A6BBE9_PRIPA|nr:hypothetical protein PRIPAC_94399 [Pristionchus pacificus]|eukprot:PDM63203.1 hypothetical protein PRIPAC_50418 [Pristionchus pacificus]
MNTPMDIASLPAWRKAYSGDGRLLLEDALPSRDPFKLFDFWFREMAARKDELTFEEINAVSVSTVSAEGRPSSRMVLLKSYDDAGFTFYTNYDSRKGTQLAGNPNAAMLFYWPKFHRQVRVEGVVEKVSFEQAEAYWNSRPVASRIGGKASAQSTVIPDRAHLERRKAELEQLVAEEGASAASKPKTWGGLLLRPRYFEFWQGQSDRLHDRICFSTDRPDAGSADFIHSADRPDWHMFRLAP